MDWTAIGTVITVLGGVWAIVTYKTNALENRIEKHEDKVFAMLIAQDEKIFQLATGKSLRDAMMEAKKSKEK